MQAGAPIRLMGGAINGISNGTYRSSLELSPGAAGGITAVNALPIDSYVRGVVAGEMPSSWHLEALKAQAVTARTYALATRKNEKLFDQYPDTRSQVYRGVRGETSRSNAAVRGTAGKILTYRGKPAVTFYFSTSGGRTENVELSVPGREPRPWLKSVDDPYDNISPQAPLALPVHASRSSARAWAPRDGSGRCACCGAVARRASCAPGSTGRAGRACSPAPRSGRGSGSMTPGPTSRRCPPRRCAGARTSRARRASCRASPRSRACSIPRRARGSCWWSAARGGRWERVGEVPTSAARPLQLDRVGSRGSTACALPAWWDRRFGSAGEKAARGRRCSCAPPPSSARR